MREIRWLRACYGAIFLLAVLAALVGWQIAGGQAHLEGVGWAWRVALPLAFAGSFVMATRAAVENETSWNTSFAGWVLALITLIVGMILLTYQVHLEEEESQESELYRTSLRDSLSHGKLKARNLPRRPA